MTDVHDGQCEASAAVIVGAVAQQMINSISIWDSIVQTVILLDEAMVQRAVTFNKRVCCVCLC